MLALPRRARQLGAQHLGNIDLDDDLALEVAECARLIKGYGDTSKRGSANYRLIETRIIDPVLGGRMPTARGLDAIASARAAALADPDVELIGIPEFTADKASMHRIAHDAVIETFESLPKPRRRDPQAVEESVKRAVRAAIAGQWQKKPTCLVQAIVV